MFQSITTGECERLRLVVGGPAGLVCIGLRLVGLAEGPVGGDGRFVGFTRRSLGSPAGLIKESPRLAAIRPGCVRLLQCFSPPVSQFGQHCLGFVADPASLVGEAHRLVQRLPGLAPHLAGPLNKELAQPPETLLDVVGYLPDSLWSWRWAGPPDRMN